MKTERMVLLVTPEEKARIAAGANQLGVSASEYVRKLVNLLDADDIQEVEQLAPILPMVGAVIDNIERNVRETLDRFDVAEREREYRQSEEYRAKVREEVLADPTINWEALNALFGERPDDREQAA